MIGLTEKQHKLLPKRPSPGRFGGFVFVAVLLIAFDQWLKLEIVKHFAYGSFEAVTSFFNLCHVRNTGAAFSFLGDAGGWQVLFFSLIAIVGSTVILLMLWRNNHRVFFSLCLTLILGGALGNMIDRITLGFVIDFLDFHYGNWHWPAFNAADIFICCGAAGVVIEELLTKRA